MRLTLTAVGVGVDAEKYGIPARVGGRILTIANAAVASIVPALHDIVVCNARRPVEDVWGGVSVRVWVSAHLLESGWDDFARKSE